MHPHRLERRRFLSVAGLAGLASLSGCTRPVAGSWSMAGHDPRSSRWNSTADGPGPSLAVAWTADFGYFGVVGDVDWTSTPVVGGERVVVGGEVAPSDHHRTGRIAAFDGRGGEDWSVDTSDPQRASPLVTADRVLHVDDGDRLVARSIADGSVEWTYEADGFPLATPLRAHEDEVLVGSGSGVVLGLDAADGAERWRFETDDDYLGSPLVAGDGSLVSVTGDAIVCYEPANEEVRWRLSVPSLEGDACLADGLVLFRQRDGVGHAIRAIDLRDGTERWTVSPQGLLQPLTVADGRLYVTAGGGRTDRDPAAVVAYDLADGRQRWETSLSSDDASYRLAAGSTFGYVSTVDGRLHALDLADGERVATVDTGLGDALTAPIVAGDRVYAGSRGRRVVAVE